MATAVQQALATAVEGLLYQSETDAPFQMFAWPDGTGSLTPERVRACSGHRPDAPVSALSLAEFFADLTGDEEWYGEAERVTARKYRSLLDVVHHYLTDARVYKVGRVQVEIYIVGRTTDGDWAGVKTNAVET